MEHCSCMEYWQQNYYLCSLYSPSAGSWVRRVSTTLFPNAATASTATGKRFVPQTFLRCTCTSYRLKLNIRQAALKISLWALLLHFPCHSTYDIMVVITLKESIKVFCFFSAIYHQNAIIFLCVLYHLISNYITAHGMSYFSTHPSITEWNAKLNHAEFGKHNQIWRRNPKPIMHYIQTIICLKNTYKWEES